MASPLYCSFCGKDETHMVVAGPGLCICVRCAEYCAAIGREKLAAAAAETSPAPAEVVNGLNVSSLRGLLKRVDVIGFGLAHHQPDCTLQLTLGEACTLSALLYRVTVQGKVPLGAVPGAEHAAPSEAEGFDAYSAEFAYEHQVGLTIYSRPSAPWLSWDETLALHAWLSEKIAGAACP